MSLDHLKQQVFEFTEQNQLGCDAVTRTLDLVSEVGELAKQILKETDYGQHPFRPSPAWELELGDTLFSLLTLAQASGVDPAQAGLKALRKYEQRIASGGSPASGQ